MVLVQDWRISVRRYWMPSSRVMLRVRVRHTRASTRRRYHRLAADRKTVSFSLLRAPAPVPGDDENARPVTDQGWQTHLRCHAVRPVLAAVQESDPDCRYPGRRWVRPQE